MIISSLASETKDKFIDFIITRVRYNNTESANNIQHNDLKLLQTPEDKIKHLLFNVPCPKLIIIL